MSDNLDREIRDVVEKCLQSADLEEEPRGKWLLSKLVPVVVALIEAKTAPLKAELERVINEAQLHGARTQAYRAEAFARAEKAEKALRYIRQYMLATKANAEDHLKLNDRDPSMCETVIMCMDDVLGEME